MIWCIPFPSCLGVLPIPIVSLPPPIPWCHFSGCMYVCMHGCMYMNCPFSFYFFAPLSLVCMYGCMYLSSCLPFMPLYSFLIIYLSTIPCVHGCLYSSLYVCMHGCMHGYPPIQYLLYTTPMHACIYHVSCPIYHLHVTSHHVMSCHALLPHPIYTMYHVPCTTCFHVIYPS